LIWDDDPEVPFFPRLKASALVMTYNYGNPRIEYVLKDGALDRVYANGTNPDPEGRGPADIPHRQRDDD
jgi:hypothetical protein